MTAIQHIASYLGKRHGAAHLVAAVLLAGTLAGAGSAGASVVQVAAAPTCPGWVAERPPDPGPERDSLDGVAVLSASDVWAVGEYTNAAGLWKTLIEHWNGKVWKLVPGPNPGIGSSYLNSVSAVSASSIWAVGSYSTQSGGIGPDRTLIEHWNGRAWKQVPSPSPGSFMDEVNTVRRLSATNIWAVGWYAGSNILDRSLILHWNGRTWRQLPSPNPGKQDDSLDGLAAVSARSVWTTEGYSNSSTSGGSLILHWNGRTWSEVAAPRGSGFNDLSASSATNVWAVGDDAKGNSLALHWNGRIWKRVPTPNLKPGTLTNVLQSVTVLSPTSAWAVGDAQDFYNFDSTAIEMHWNGRTWSMMTSPAPGGTSGLFAVQATSAVSPWAVGEYGTGFQFQQALAFRCR
jgi:hypothetical protein